MSLTRVSLSMIGIAPTTISVDTTISYDLFIGSGQVITIAAGKTLTINGFFTAGVYQVFDTSSGGTVVFGEGAATEYYPEWWLESGGDFGAAASKCFTATKNAGAKIVFTKSHTCTTPINCTANQRGWVVEGRGGSGASSDWGVTIGIGHTGVGFDCSGSEHMIFRDLKIKGGPLGQNPVTTIPKVGILFARNATSSGCGKHSLYNVTCDYVSKFSVAALYNYGAEEMLYVNCFFLNSTVDRSTVVITCSNPFAITSSFITLSVLTNQSTSVHKFIGGEYWNQGGGTTTNVIYLDGVAEASFDGGLYLNDTGKSLFYVNTDNAATVDITIRNIRDEGFATGTVYAIWMHAGAQTPLNWIIEGNVFRSNTNVLYADDTVTPQSITYRNNIDANAAGISVKNLTLSDLDMNTALFTGRAGGVILQCDIAGNYASLTFNGSSVNTTIRDYQYNSLTAKGNSSASALPVGTLTLTANAATTTISSLPFIKSTSSILLTPTSSTAAADVASGVYVSSISAGVSFTITHPNNANANKTFSYMIFTGS